MKTAGNGADDVGVFIRLTAGCGLAFKKKTRDIKCCPTRRTY